MLTVNYNEDIIYRMLPSKDSISSNVQLYIFVSSYDFKELI